MWPYNNFLGGARDKAGNRVTRCGPAAGPHVRPTARWARVGAAAVLDGCALVGATTAAGTARATLG
ncbi:hypothetical protein [Streptomyces guryensis]|uniref:hypothetical protein n=1 Tax=Streptomyces guryensis TaxID=2886947 RepID=UPI00355913AC